MSMTNSQKLNETRPDLIELFSGMDKEQLFEAACGEALDALAMEERVELFMSECTSMSKSNYTLDSIRGLISDHKEQEINEFCLYISEDSTDDMILHEVKSRAKDAL